jgi:autotransporter-associated beta strand protein
MKTKFRYLTGLVTLTLILPASADTIYSGLLDTPIPTDFTGTTVTIAGGTLNPFFGGVGVANNNLLQPFRDGTGNLDTLLNLSVGTTIDAGTVYLSSGYGGSVDHLGASFMAGTEGYLGFKLNNSNYGWMRVVFTNNTSGAMIKDWAYDNGGGAIATGNVLQSGSTVTLNSAFGSFTLGSQVSGANSVVKDGANSATLTGTNNYSGTTTVNEGDLLVNGSITGTGAVGVGGGATVATLGGTGSIAGAVTMDDNGILSPGASIESLATGALTFNTGSTFDYEMDSSALPAVAADFQQVFGALALSGTVTLNLTDLDTVSPTMFAPGTTFSLIKYAGAWNGGFFTYAGNELSNNEVFTAGLNTWKIIYNAGNTEGGINFATEYNDLSGQFVNLTSLTAIPEPGGLLTLGCLVGSGVFLRSRRRR